MPALPALRSRILPGRLGG